MRCRIFKALRVTEWLQITDRAVNHVIVRGYVAFFIDGAQTVYSSPRTVFTLLTVINRMNVTKEHRTVYLRGRARFVWQSEAKGTVGGNDSSMPSFDGVDFRRC